VIVLHECLADAELGKRALIVALEEKPALVAEHARLEQQKIGQAGGDFLHRTLTRTVLSSKHAVLQQLQ
jgi:hypothetical protein